MARTTLARSLRNEEPRRRSGESTFPASQRLRLTQQRPWVYPQNAKTPGQGPRGQIGRKMEDNNKQGRHYKAYKIDKEGNLKEFKAYTLNDDDGSSVFTVGEDECGLHESDDGIVVMFGANSDWQSRHFVLAEAMKYFARLEAERN